MSDVIRLARHARHYLAIFDKGKTLALYHTKRPASPGQRIVLYGKHRGCSAPACTVGGYYCEVHHVISLRQLPHHLFPLVGVMFGPIPQDRVP